MENKDYLAGAMHNLSEEEIGNGDIFYSGALLNKPIIRLATPYLACREYIEYIQNVVFPICTHCL